MKYKKFWEISFLIFLVIVHSKTAKHDNNGQSEFMHHADAAATLINTAENLVVEVKTNSQDLIFQPTILGTSVWIWS